MLYPTAAWIFLFVSSRPPSTSLHTTANNPYHSSDNMNVDYLVALTSSTMDLVPRLRMFNTTMNRALTQTLERLRPDPHELRNSDVMNEDVLRIALSDMEEVRERQRFLKYDLLWQRAEEAFVKSKQDQLKWR